MTVRVEAEQRLTVLPPCIRAYFNNMNLVIVANSVGCLLLGRTILFLLEYLGGKNPYLFIRTHGCQGGWYDTNILLAISIYRSLFMPIYPIRFRNISAQLVIQKTQSHRPSPHLKQHKKLRCKNAYRSKSLLPLAPVSFNSDHSTTNYME